MIFYYGTPGILIQVVMNLKWKISFFFHDVKNGEHLEIAIDPCDLS